MSILMVARDLVPGHPVTAAAYRAVAVARAQRVGRSIVEDARGLVAYANAGRWIADCWHCGAGVMLDPRYAFAACLGAGCHRVYTLIVWPEDRGAIETALEPRPIRNRNWGYARGTSRSALVLAESTADLEAENAYHLPQYQPPGDDAPEDGDGDVEEGA